MDYERNKVKFDLFLPHHYLQTFNKPSYNNDSTCFSQKPE